METKTQLTEENNRLRRVCNSREEEIRDLKKALVLAQQNFSEERENARAWRERALKAEGYRHRVLDEDQVRVEEIKRNRREHLGDSTTMEHIRYKSGAETIRS